MESRTEAAVDPLFQLDRGPVDSLGWGTTEDLRVDLGAGAAVSVFSGNLVVGVRPFIRGDAVPDTQLALTYNHLDAEGSAGLAPGWRHDLDRKVVVGAWGGRVLVDGDGYRDSFLPSSLPSSDEVLRVLDDVLVAWRRSTSAAARREVGGLDAMRAALVADPLFLGEMRLKLLGPPDDADELEVLTSTRRGNRSLARVRETDEYVLLRGDGGSERYDPEGRLVEVEARGGPKARVVREGGRLVGLEVGGKEVFHVVPDASDRVRKVRSSLGYTADFDYVDRLLYRLRLPGGAMTFQYDTMGRLVGFEGPLGAVTVGYDDASGRVAWAKGPQAQLELSDVARDGGDIQVEVRGLSGGSRSCSWSPTERTRTVRRGTEVRQVRFDRDRPLPEEVREPSGILRFSWDDSGRLVSTSREGLSVSWERDTDGVLTALVDASGARAKMVRSESSSLLGWSDPVGRRTSITMDERGLPQLIVRPGGLTERVHRTQQHRIRSVDLAGRPAVTLRRDSRGFPRAILGPAGSTAVLRFDSQGRLSGLTSSTGPELTLSYTGEGRVASLEDGRSTPQLAYGRGGRLLGWTVEEESVRLLRNEDDLLLGLERNGVVDWKLSRSAGGRVSGLEQSGWRTQSFEFHEDGMPRAWDSLLGGRFTLRRDRSGVVDGWVEATGAEVRRRVDGRGQSVAVERGGGSWTIERDLSGRPIGLVDAVGSAFAMTLDSAGRVERIAAPEGITSTFQRDGRGRLSRIRQGDVAWSLRRDSSGRPAVFIDPEGTEVVLDWDRSGRWISLQRPDRDELRVSYGSFGPTRVGLMRRFYGPRGALVGWGPVEAGWRWDYGRNDQRQIVDVSARPLGAGAVATSAVPRRPRLVIDRGDGGLPVRVGAHRLVWRDGLLEQTRTIGSSSDSLAEWTSRRDSKGRVVSWSVTNGSRAEVERDALGDVRRLLLQPADGREPVAWMFRRDATARVVLAEREDGLRWDLQRDALGRVRRWHIHGAEEGGMQIALKPLDGTGLATNGVLSEALGVSVPGAPPEGGLPSGSRRFEARLDGGAEVLSFDEVRSVNGDFSRMRSVQEATLGELDLPEALDEDPIGALLPSSKFDDRAQAQDREALSWGGTALEGADGTLFLPSPFSGGVGVAGIGWFRLATGDGETVSWLGPGADLRALRVPLASGDWLTPDGWLERMEWDPTEGDRVAVSLLEQAPAPPGLAGAAADWWWALGGDPDGLARLPRGVSGSSMAWERPRQRLFAEDALLGGDDAEAGPGGGLPRIPGAERLLPQAPHVHRLAPLDALVLSGDLPLLSSEHRAWLDVPPVPWLIAVPGAAWLHHLAERRAWPSVPESWSRGVVAGASHRLDGVVTRGGTDARWLLPYELQPAVELLPAGTRDLVPGVASGMAGGSSSLPVDGRNTALEALSGDPHAANSPWQGVVHSDATLLFLRAIAAGDAVDSYSSLGLEGDGEHWAVETPSGVRMVVDGRGRLLSVDALGRLHESWGRWAVQRAGSALVNRGGGPLGSDRLLERPAFLPGSGLLPESRWGLVPADPRLPLDAQGRIPWLVQPRSSQPDL